MMVATACIDNIHGFGEQRRPHFLSVGTGMKHRIGYVRGVW